ncbi:MAG: DNA polymerase III subunit beta [Clostridiales bacterium]|jgi:DNA polymerase-3 subunit beta|nr:DNA polymerase III subunit beta [Clostridiales bacterium]
MKFFCESAELADAVLKVSKALPVKKQLPILEGMKFKAEGDVLTILASDLELSIQKTIKADIKIEGEVVVSGRFITDFVKKLKDENIEIGVNNNQMTITYSENKVILQCLNADEYPPILLLSADNESGFEIDGKDFKNMLEKVIFCAATDDVRPIYKGCNIETAGNVITAVALNGVRLGYNKRILDGDFGELKFIAPSRSLSEVSKLIDEPEGKVKVILQKNSAQFNIGSTTIITRLIEGNFIDHKKIVPTEFSVEATADKKQMEEAIERASLILREEKGDIIKFEIKENAVEITSKSELGNIKETVTAGVKGKDLAIAFNAKYLLDMLRNIDETYIKMHFKNSTSPCVIKPIEGDAYLYLILPIKLNA